jgi:hypothetical protein
MTNRDQSKKIDKDNDMPENIKRDPNRDLSQVPGSYNPGNQAGKGGDDEEDRTPSHEGVADPAPGSNPRR